MRILITISLCFALLIFSHGQDNESRLEYMHMVGSLGPYELICDLVISGKEINGNAYSPGRTGDISIQEGYTFGYRLQGILDEYGVANIEAYQGNQFSAKFSGKLTSQYKGTFRPDGSDMVRSFLLNEEYTESIAFQGYKIQRDSSLIDSAGAPKASISISLLLPEYRDTLSYIRGPILKAFFGKQELSMYPDDAILPVYAEMYFAKYIESNIDIYNGGYSFNWEMLGTSYINLNRNGLLVYRADNYGYSGGAHGIGASFFLVFDTRLKIQLDLEDIFVESYIKDLSMLLEKKYREQIFLDDDESLIEAGLFEEHIHPSENFWITDEGIAFYYNPYQLAPYAMGPINISLHKDEVLDLLKPDSPVKRLGW